MSNIYTSPTNYKSYPATFLGTTNAQDGTYQLVNQAYQSSLPPQTPPSPQHFSYSASATPPSKYNTRPVELPQPQGSITSRHITQLNEQPATPPTWRNQPQQENQRKPLVEVKSASLAVSQQQRRQQLVNDSPQTTQKPLSALPPVTPPRKTTQPEFADTPRPVMQCRTTPPVTPPQNYVLNNFRYTFSPMSPLSIQTGLYQQTRSKMQNLKITHEQLQNLMSKFWCSDYRERDTQYFDPDFKIPVGQFRFTELFSDKFRNYSFPMKDQGKMIAMDNQLGKFYQSLGSARTKFKKTMQLYQLYEQLMKSVHRNDQSQMKLQIDQIEKTLPTLQVEVEIEIFKLKQAFQSFVFELASYFSGKAVINETDALRIFENNHREYSKDRPKPATFAGMSHDYKHLIDSTRMAQGSAWINQLIEAYLDDKYPQLKGQALMIPIQGLSQWVIDAENRFLVLSENVQDLILDVKLTIGTQSLDHFLKLHHQGKDEITYPYAKSMLLTPAMNKHLNEANSPALLQFWMDRVNRYFTPSAQLVQMYNPVTNQYREVIVASGDIRQKNVNSGWLKNAPLNLKEMAVVIHCSKLTLQDKALAAKAKLLAELVVKHIYTEELTSNTQ